MSTYEKFHIGKNGPAPCKANQRKCRYDDSSHYATMEDATSAWEASEKEAVSGSDVSSSIKKPETEKPNYSFVRNFQGLEKEFNEEFDGVPNRFFNANLRGKYTDYSIPSEGLEKFTDQYTKTGNLGGLQKGLIDQKADIRRLAQSFSSKSELDMSAESLSKAFQKLDHDGEIEEVTDSTVLRSFRTQRAWFTKVGDTGLLVTSASQASKNFNHYRLRSGGLALNDGHSVAVLDARTVAGLARMNHVTKRNLLLHGIGSFRSSPQMKEEFAAVEKTIDKVTGPNDENDPSIRIRRRRFETQWKHLRENADVIAALGKAEEAQRKGANFKAQQKFVRESSQSIASAWEDKKSYKASHVDAMKRTVLNRDFRKVDIDDDVDLQEFENFTNDYLEVRDKLPSLGDTQPRLGIRKLGKHRASGLYVPSVETIMVDVHDSSSFIHEYGHHLDLTVHRNASLSRNFASIQSRYSRSLRTPEGSPKDASYYSTPTEVHSRLFELYAVERLGIRNRLVDPDKFDNFDFEPFKDESLKREGFAFLDGIFKKP